jgi:hypothetical protein
VAEEVAAATEDGAGDEAAPVAEEVAAATKDGAGDEDAPVAEEVAAATEDASEAVPEVSEAASEEPMGKAEASEKGAAARVEAE